MIAVPDFQLLQISKLLSGLLGLINCLRLSDNFHHFGSKLQIDYLFARNLGHIQRFMTKITPVARTLLNGNAMGGKMPSGNRLCHTWPMVTPTINLFCPGLAGAPITRPPARRSLDQCGTVHCPPGSEKVPEIFLRPHNLVFSRFLVVESNLNFWQQGIQMEYLI